MAIIKCKMCGGDLRMAEGAATAQCEYCGSVQTVPKVDEEKMLSLFARANRLRIACDFDKAAALYSSIVADFPEESEAYWGLLLCKYGIEYVTDPVTGKKVPTCHRTSFQSVLEDEDLEQAIENAGIGAQGLYREEAKQFEKLRKGILEVSASEKPYDIFICYKETDEKGQRTLDSVLAQDLYTALTDKGYRVFFSRVTLREKLGEAYEPYIFAALQSAKVMLAVGTCFAYYNAVWVKNEWSRFLKLCTTQKDKYLIPCYKDIDPEDMPKEFRHLQGSDLGKMGAIQDVLFNIEKYIPLQKNVESVRETVIQTIVTPGNVNTLLERVAMFLEDGQWRSANEYCEKVLDMEPKNVTAYLYKLLAEQRVKKKEELRDRSRPFDNSISYQKLMAFGDDALKAELEGYVQYIKSRNADNERERIYSRAVKEMGESRERSYASAKKRFESIPGYKDADALAQECDKLRETARRDDILIRAEREMTHIDDLSDYENARRLLASIPGWRDADEKLAICDARLVELRKINEQVTAKRKKVLKGSLIIGGVLTAVAIILAIVIIVAFICWLAYLLD